MIDFWKCMLKAVYLMFWFLPSLVCFFMVYLFENKLFGIQNGKMMCILSCLGSPVHFLYCLSERLPSDKRGVKAHPVDNFESGYGAETRDQLLMGCTLFTKKLELLNKKKTFLNVDAWNATLLWSKRICKYRKIFF